MEQKRKPLGSRSRFASVLVCAGALLGVMVLGACSSSDDAPPPTTGIIKFKIFPPNVYAGFDGQNKYRAPVVVTGTGRTVEWTLSDPSLATLDVSIDGVILTTKKAGTGTLSAKVLDKVETVPLTISAYTPAQHAEGLKRYTNSSTSGPACNSCHGPDKGAPDHTPTQIAAYTDEQVVKTIITGIDPEGVPLVQPNHTWPVSDAEKAGLIPYLRALDPKGFPAPGGVDDEG